MKIDNTNNVLDSDSISNKLIKATIDTEEKIKELQQSIEEEKRLKSLEFEGISEEDVDDSIDLSDFDISADLIDDLDETIISELEDQGE